MVQSVIFHLEGAIKPEDEYAYYRFTDKKPILVGEKRTLALHSGDVFGARWSTNRKLIRLVLKAEPSKVFTITRETGAHLAKRCTLVKKGKNWSAT